MFMYEKFQEICNERGTTPYQVSNATGVATSTLTMWKQGKYTPKIDKVKAIAEHFGVPISYFLESEGTDNENNN